MDFESVKFIPGDMAVNFKLLLERYDLSSEEKVGNLISSFTIILNNETHKTEVSSGKYKSALLILYIADCLNKSSFILNDEIKEIIKDYFPTNLVQEAQDNPETKHQTIYHLLVQGVVLIEIERKK